MTVTIYHNPACGTSRNALAMIRAAGIEPVIIEYLKTPPSRETLKAIVKATGGSLRALLREKDTPLPSLGWAIRNGATMNCWNLSHSTRSC
jgi:arsenate reductase (glutaredoxin)